MLCTWNFLLLYLLLELHSAPLKLSLFDKHKQKAIPYVIALWLHSHVRRHDGHYFCFLFAYSCLCLLLCFMLYVECKSSNKCRDYWTRRPPIMNCDCDPQRWGRISRQFGWELLQSKLRIGRMRLVEEVWCMITDDLEVLIVGVVDDETQRGQDCMSLWDLRVHPG